LNRLTFVSLALGTIVLGLAVHFFGSGLSAAFRDVLGDLLWAAMIAWWIGAIAPHAALRIRAIIAIAFCFLVEMSQLYDTPSLDARRGTTIGQLTLGSGFDPRDLFAYTAGVLLAVLIENLRRRNPTPR
jgi:hypothetical protein